MVDKKEPEQIAKKLNLIASLLLDMNQNLGEQMSIKEKVAYLVGHGITEDEDISQILNITRSHASKEKAILKRGVKNE